MVTKRQKQVAGLAAAALLLAGSAYAWSSTNQHKTNELKSKSGAANDVTLVENFEPVEDWQESQTINKDISVKNNTETVGGSNAYVRINLREFLEFTGRKEVLSDVRYAVTTAGNFAKFPNTPAGLAAAQAYATANGLDVADIVVVPTTAYDGDDQYFIKTKEGSYHGQYGKLLVLGFEDDSAPVSIIGGTNASEDAKRDPDEDGDESDGKHQDPVNGEDAYYLQKFAATGTSLNAKRNYTTLNTAVPNGDGIAPGTNLNNYITWNFGPNVMMLEDYKASTVTTGKWVIDKSTGWVYWSNPLKPGETTDLFLDSVTLTESPRNVALYYAIHTHLEAVDASGKDGLGDIPDEIEDSWEKGKTYAITYDANGGTPATLTQQVKSGDKLTKPADPTKTGQTFGGWYKESGLSTPWQFDTDTMPSTNLTLYAKWTDATYTVSVAANGGTGGSASPTSYTYKASATSTITLTRPTAPTGKVFSSWTAPTGTTISGDTLTITAGATGNKSVTANWTDATYTVSVAANGGTGGSASPTSYTYKASATSTITLTRPTAPTGKVFSSWTAPTGTTISGDTLTITAGATGNKSVTANWTDATYTVSVAANGGTGGSASPTSYTYKASGTTDITLTKPTAPTGKVFSSWTAPTGTTISGDTLTITAGATGNKSVTANWTDATYTVSVAANGGTGGSASPTSYTYKASGTTAITLTRPTAPTGKVFSSWTAPTGTTISGDTLTITAGATGNKSVTANWNNVNYTLTFESNGGTAVTAQTLTYGQTATQPTAPTKTGHTFSGWYSASDLSGSAWNFSTDTMPASNKTLYAKWTANNYTVTYKNEDGSTHSTATPTYGLTFSAPTSPTKTGHTFDGWYTDSGTKWNFTGMTMPANNMTLTARFTANTYTITFSANGGTGGSASRANYTYNASTATTVTLTRPTAPAGKEFDQWQITGGTTTLSGNTLTISAGSNAAITVKAIWKDTTAVTVPSTNPGSEFEFADSQWRILDKDMDDDASNGLQALVIKVDKIGDSMFNDAAGSRTRYYTAATGANGYTDSASGGLKKTIDNWYTANIASNPALAISVNKVNLNLPDFAAFSNGITFSGGSTAADWIWGGAQTATTNFSQDIRFKTTLDTAGAKQAFALSFGDIHTHMQVPVGDITTSLLAFGGSDYTLLRSSGGEYNYAGLVSTAGQFNVFTGLGTTRAVRPALSLTIQ